MVSAVRMDWRVHPRVGLFRCNVLMVFSQVTHAAEIGLRFTAPDVMIGFGMTTTARRENRIDERALGVDQDIATRRPGGFVGGWLLALHPAVDLTVNTRADMVGSVKVPVPCHCPEGSARCNRLSLERSGGCRCKELRWYDASDNRLARCESDRGDRILSITENEDGPTRLHSVLS